MVFRKKFLFWIISILILFFLFDGFIKGAWALTTEEEKKMGKKVFLEMEGKVDFVRDLTLQTFLDKMGRSLVAQISPTPFEFKFYLINASDPNAFALPGGYIFITTGIFVLAENEHEIAAVLSHEISHVTARHISKLIEKSKGINIASMAAVIAAMLVGGGGTGSQAAATMAMATGEALALKYTREMEVDADHNGLQLLTKAGYDPNGMITFMNKMFRMSLALAPKIPAYLSDHPGIEDRLSLLENLLQMGPKFTGPFTTFGNFKRIQAKAFVEERESQVAITHYQSIADGNPNNIEGYYGLGLAYQKMGRLDKSMEAFQKANALAPKDVDILREVGIVYFFSGKIDQAIENFETIQSTFQMGDDQGDDLLTLYYLGRGYQERGDFTKALPLFLKIQKLMPEFVEVYQNIGSVYGRMGQKGLSHYYFGKHFKLRGDKKNALLHFRTALEWLEEGSSGKEETQREIQELTQSK